jgi:hypothetical protein
MGLKEAKGLTGVLGQLANFEGVAEIIRDYQKCMQPWEMTTNRWTWSTTGVAVGGGSELGWRLRG